MNLVQIIESARPDIASMPPLARHHLRERLFDVTNERQLNPAGLEVNTTNSRSTNALRIGALALIGAVGVGGLAYSASRDTGRAIDAEPIESTVPASGDPERSTVTVPPPPTVASTTTIPPLAGTAEAPLLLPEERTRLDELQVSRKQLGGSSLLLRTADLATIALRETDGVAPAVPVPTTTDPDEPIDTQPVLPPRQFGDFEVSLPGEPGVYDVRLPCGTLEVREGIGFLPYRPAITELFGSMSFDAGSIDIELPAGWSVISVGESTDEFVLGIPVDVNGRDVSIVLSQYPNGSLAVAGFGDKQFAPATFNDQPAWISRNREVPGQFELIGMLGTTAFSVETRDIALVELERVLARLQPGDVDEWVDRFGRLSVSPDPDIRGCQDQPEFNVISP